MPKNKEEYTSFVISANAIAMIGGTRAQKVAAVVVPVAVTMIAIRTEAIITSNAIADVTLFSCKDTPFFCKRQICKILTKILYETEVSLSISYNKLKKQLTNRKTYSMLVLST